MSETAFRETYLWCLREPEHVELLRRLGDLLYDLALESPYGDWGASHGLSAPRGDATAAAADLARLADYLQMIADQPADLSVQRDDLDVCRAADGWARRVRRVVEEIRETVGQAAEDDGGG